MFHDSIRKWFELKLDRPECGQTSIEVMRINADWTPVEVLRGCRVRSSGTIDFSPTGYYSLDTYQAVEKIEPVGECAKQLPFPDYSKTKPDKSVREYRVEMHIDYEPGDHAITFRVSDAGKELQPWQPYASYMLTGSFVLYEYCGKGFVVDEFLGRRRRIHHTLPSEEALTMRRRLIPRARRHLARRICSWGTPACASPDCSYDFTHIPLPRPLVTPNASPYCTSGLKITPWLVRLFITTRRGCGNAGGGRSPVRRPRAAGRAIASRRSLPRHRDSR